MVYIFLMFINKYNVYILYYFKLCKDIFNYDKNLHAQIND